MFRKTKETFFVEEGVDGQKTKKQYGILKGKTGKTRKQQNRKKRRILKTELLEEQKRKNLQNCRTVAFLGSFFFFKKGTKIKRTKKPTTKKIQKNFLHVGKQPPNFGTFLFFQLTLSYFCKVSFAENTLKIVFSAVHSFVYHRPFSRPLPCVRWSPRKSDIFKNRLCQQKCPCFRLPNTNSVCLFLKSAILAKNIFVPNHPKTQFVEVFLNNCPFTFFHLCSFSLSNIKRQKQKCIFRKPSLDTPTTCNICDSKMPKAL